MHPTQYGRICPIATPEGPNIGLVLHFASYARVDKYGFITTPFRDIIHTVKVNENDLLNRITLEDVVDAKGKLIVPEKTLISAAIASEIVKNIKTETIEVRGFLSNTYTYFDAYEERELVITEANTSVDEFGNFTETRLSARRASEATVAYVRDVTHIDISPKQLMSETTTLIPFLEHDDATRAEMGTNMMRQAVPSIRAEAPIVGTGMERLIAEGSGYVVKATDDGEVI